MCDFGQDNSHSLYYITAFVVNLRMIARGWGNTILQLNENIPSDGPHMQVQFIRQPKQPEMNV